MRIEAVKLINFQAHAKRVVKMSPGITTIKGATDAGKSAILRALGWCCLNNISGDEFIKEGEKRVSVSIKTTHDDTMGIIERERSAGGVNTYEMSGEEYKSFGQGVPDAIAKHLAMGDLNFQGQHDAPFWFSETAGEVSRQLNAVIDLTVIDSSLGYVSSEVRKHQWRKTLCQERIDEVSKELAEIEPQRERISYFRDLEELKTKRDKHHENFSRLEELITNIRTNKTKEHQAHHSAASEVLAMAEDSRGHTNTIEKLQRAIKKIERYQSLAVAVSDFTQVENDFREWQNALHSTEHLREIVIEVETATTRKMIAVSKQDEAEKTFHKQTKGKQCPLCKNLME